MSTVEITNWFTLVRPFRIRAITAKTATGVRCGACAMDAGVLTDWYAKIKEQRLVARQATAYTWTNAFTVLATTRTMRFAFSK